MESLPQTIPPIERPQAPTPSSPKAFVTYEQLLNQDTRWALSEGSLFFEGRGRVQETLRRITARLDQLGIPYAVAGGMALFLHGYRRFTEDVDILVTREGLERIHEELDGRGYLRPFSTSKNLRDTESKVKIEFLITGGYPGDGRPKDIAFPDPAEAAEIRDGMRVLQIPRLISLKLASGMTGEARTKDLADVEELIRFLKLPLSLSQSLHAFVQEKYEDVWRRVNPPHRRYLLPWRVSRTPAPPLTIDELIASAEVVSDQLAAMRDAGVTVDSRGEPASGYVYLMTNDPAVADRFGMHDESEFLDLENTPPQ